MNHHAGLLVEHQHIIIFIYYVQRNVFRKNLKPAALVRHHKLDHITGTYDIIGLHYLVIHTDIFSLDGKLDTMTRGIFHMGGQILVDSHRYLTCRNVKAVVFEHLLLFILVCHFISGLRKIKTVILRRTEIFSRHIIKIKEFLIHLLAVLSVLPALLTDR